MSDTEPGCMQDHQADTIIALITRDRFNLLKPDQANYLLQWVAACDENRQMFQEFIKDEQVAKMLADFQVNTADALNNLKEKLAFTD